MPLLAMRLLSIRARSLAGYRVHTLLCRGSGLPVCFLLSPANVHDAPFARPLLEWAMRLYNIHPSIIRLDAAYWGLRLIAWIHATLHAVAVIPWNRHSPAEPLLLTTHLEAREELGKRSSIERFFGRVFPFFHVAASTSVWLVGHRTASRLDLYRLHHRWPGCSTRRASRSHPFSKVRSRSYLGGICMMNENALKSRDISGVSSVYLCRAEQVNGRT